MSKKQYTDAERAEYWKKKALEGSKSKYSNGYVSPYEYSNNMGAGKNYKQRSGAKIELLQGPKEKFEKLFAWKFTKKIGLMSLNGFAMLEQATKDGEQLKDGYEKWRFIVKTPTGQTTYFGMYNKKKSIFFFEMGTTKCIISANKNYWSFAMPKGLKNKR